MIKNRVVVHQGPSAEEAGRAALALVAMGFESDTRRVQYFVPRAGAPSAVSAIPTAESAAEASDGQSVPASGLAPSADDAASTAERAGSPSAAAPVGGPVPGRIVARTLWQVLVDEDDGPAALAILAEALEPEETIPAPAPLPFRFGDPSEGIWTARHSASSLLIAALCVAVHFAVHGSTGGPSPRSTMIDAGAIAPWLVDRASGGDWQARCSCTLTCNTSSGT